MRKRAISLLLALVLCLGLIPTAAVAAEDDFVIENGVLTKYTGPGGDVVIPDGVTEIGDGAFRRTDVTSVVIPDTVTRIGDSAFYQCRSLTNITIPDGVTQIGNAAFSSTMLGSVTIPDSVERIEAKAFDNCFLLTDVDLGHGVKVIGEYAFQETSIKDLVIPDSVRTIENGAFTYCRALCSVTIPPSVESIHKYAFINSQAPGTIVKIYCEAGSVAETYARSLSNGEPVLGTFDTDGTFIPDETEEPSETEQPKETEPPEETEKPEETESPKETESPEGAEPSPTPTPDPEPTPEPEDKWAEWKRVQEQREQRTAGYKYDASYQKRLKQNQEYLDSNFYDYGKLAYAYIIVTDDVQAKSDEICRGLVSDRDKVYAIHQWVTENIYYDYPDAYSTDNNIERSRTAQIALDRKTAVCKGYAYLFQALCWAQKIPCNCNVGWVSSGGAHAWNLVKVGGEWLWVDTTWDTYNAYYGDDYWKEGSTRLDYFLCSTEVISIDHTTASSDEYLMCPIGLADDDNVTYPYYQIYMDLRWDQDNYQVKPGFYLYSFTDEELAEASKVRVEYGLTPYVRVEDSTTGGNGSSTQDKQEQEWLEQEKQRQELQDRMFRSLDLSDWARDEVISALQTSLVPEQIQRYYRRDITREEFCVLMVYLLAQYSGKDIDTYLNDLYLTRPENPFVDTNNSDVLAAYALGIVKGTSEITFNPDGKITRQEAATMLARTGRLLNIKAGEGLDFSDANTFADWSGDSISYVSGLTDPYNSKRVMEGTGGGNFSPLATYSREQAIITALRLFSASGKQTTRTDSSGT